MEMTLHYAPNTCALAVHIALLEAGIEFELQRVDFASNEQRTPAYLALNPKGRVPTLLTQRGPLTETPAILAFIAQSRPEAHLSPASDPFAFAQMQAFNSYLCSTVHVAHAHGRRGRRWADNEAAIESMRRQVPTSMRTCFELMEKQLVGSPWVLGEQFTVCDPYLFTVARWLAYDNIDIALYPRIHEQYLRMSERPSVRTAMSFQSAVNPTPE